MFVRHRLLRRGCASAGSIMIRCPRTIRHALFARVGLATLRTAVTADINQLLMRKALQSTAYDGAGHAVNVA